MTQDQIFRPHHINYAVSDLERSIEYYRDVLGLKLIQNVVRENLSSYDELMGVKGVKLRVAIFEIPKTALLLELFQFFNPPSIRQQVGYHYIGSSHIAYEAFDLDAIYRRLIERGHKVFSPPVDIIREGQVLAKAMYALDPDGIVLEMLEPTEVGRRSIPGFKSEK